MKRTIRTSKAYNWRNSWPEEMKFLKRRIMIQRAVFACERFCDPKARWIGAGCDFRVKSLGSNAMYPLRKNFAERWRDKYPEAWNNFKNSAKEKKEKLDKKDLNKIAKKNRRFKRLTNYFLADIKKAVREAALRGSEK